MCGIIGIVNKEKSVVEDLIYGLNQMEYRGYDSAGIIFSNKFETYKSIQSLENLKNASMHNQETCALAHTRWATHGEVSLTNTHPIIIEKYAIVHNGIIEETNLLQQTIKYKPQTQTDTEILLAYFVYLIKKYPLEETLKLMNEKIKGSYATAIIELNTKKIIWLKKGFSPLIIAETNEGNCIASDEEALKEAKKIYEINTNGYGYITENEIKIIESEYTEHKKEQIKQKEEKQYETWLEKEINEQKIIYHNEKNISLKQSFEKYNNIKLIGCGSSFFAAELGAMWLEEENYIASAAIASEWNVAKTSIKSNQLAIFISQSGFTADTLSALLKAKKTHETLALVNKTNSPISNNSQKTIQLNAGNEKSVASTKSFSTQIIKLYQLIKGQLPLKIEAKIDNILKIDIENIAQILAKSQEIIILGKNKMNIVAKEGMLKITEITYLNVFAYPAGELKHGYISKITNETYSIILAPEDPILLHKTISSTQEILCRKGNVIWISNENHINTPYFIQTEKMNYDEATFCYVIILQKLALRIAEILKRSIDKPRNLAKSVTVE